MSPARTGERVHDKCIELKSRPSKGGGSKRGTCLSFQSRPSTPNVCSREETAGPCAPPWSSRRKHALKQLEMSVHKVPMEPALVT